VFNEGNLNKMNFERRFSEVAQSPQFAAIFKKNDNPFLKAVVSPRKVSLNY
jgi:hypothetical protein